MSSIVPAKPITLVIIVANKRYDEFLKRSISSSSSLKKLIFFKII